MTLDRSTDTECFMSQHALYIRFSTFELNNKFDRYVRTHDV